MIVIVDYNMGNVGSILNMLKKIGVKAVISSDPNCILAAEKIILPGVGAFDEGMKNLKELNLIPLLDQKVLVDKVPVLGICLGMQLFTHSSEEGNLPGLGWLKAETKKFDLGSDLKIPHMGWNLIQVKRKTPFSVDIPDGVRFYFVHSYHVVCENSEDVLSTTIYGKEFVSAIEKENILGMQFHPEKSHKFGIQIFKNFVENFNYALT